MTIHAQKKGKRGEVEFCGWLKENLGIDIERNYNQADGHSADVITEDFIFEVKRREAIDLGTWWYQVSMAKKKHKNEDLIPVVCFRQNRKPWQFLIPANLLNGVDKGYMLLNESVFIDFAKAIVAQPEEDEEADYVMCSGYCGELGKPNYEDGMFFCGATRWCIP